MAPDDLPCCSAIWAIVIPPSYSAQTRWSSSLLHADPAAVSAVVARRRCRSGTGSPFNNELAVNRARTVSAE